MQSVSQPACLPASYIIVPRTHFRSPRASHLLLVHGVGPNPHSSTETQPHRPAPSTVTPTIHAISERRVPTRGIVRAGRIPQPSKAQLLNIEISKLLESETAQILPLYALTNSGAEKSRCTIAFHATEDRLLPRIRTSKRLWKQRWHFKNSAHGTLALPIPILAHSAVVISSSPARGQHRGRTRRTITILTDRAPPRSGRRCGKMEGQRTSATEPRRDAAPCGLRERGFKPRLPRLERATDHRSAGLRTDSDLHRHPLVSAFPMQAMRRGTGTMRKTSRCPNASTRKSGNHSPDGNSALTTDLKYLLPPDSDRVHAAPARACLAALSDNAQRRTSARADSESAISERTAGALVRRAARSRLRDSESSVRPPANSRATPRWRGSTPDDLIPQNSTQHCPGLADRAAATMRTAARTEDADQGRRIRGSGECVTCGVWCLSGW
jgi:hypothetical protein